MQATTNPRKATLRMTTPLNLRRPRRRLPLPREWFNANLLRTLATR